MFRFTKIYLSLLIAVFLQVNFAYSQDVRAGNAVKWEGISDKNKEFVVFMPAGYTSVAEGEHYLGKPPGAARVVKLLRLARYINGVALVIEYYEGKAKDISKSLQEREKLSPEKETEINGFQVKHFSAKSGKDFQKTHYYFLKENLYVVKAFAKSGDDKIVKGFFESVRLINQNVPVAPNAPPDAKSTSLPTLTEQEISRLDDSMAIPSTEADREPIILRAWRPNFPFNLRAGMINVRVKVKALFSSSGKVTDVEVLEVASNALKVEAVESTKRISFIPAEKNGKLVSVYKTIEYRSDSDTR